MPARLPPEDEIARLRAEKERLLIALHDAIRRPMGVTPDSAVEFYSHRMADEAEARRPRHVSRFPTELVRHTEAPATPAPWPTGCIKPRACARHDTCVYAQSPTQCRHFGRDISAEVEEAIHAR